MTRPRGDDGSVSAFVLLLMPALLSVLGLVVDGSRALTARQRATNHAEQAARAGAAALTETDLRAGRLRPDPVAARRAALAYLRRIGDTGTVAVHGDTVTVTVRATSPTTLLRRVGFTSFPVVGAGTARPIRTDRR